MDRNILQGKELTIIICGGEAEDLDNVVTYKWKERDRERQREIDTERQWDTDRER